MTHADVVVVGAGTAGAAVARACARAGLTVVCMDRGRLDQAGARWVNGVPAWCFEQGELDLPVWPERRGGGGVFHMVAGWGPERLSFPTEGHLEVDMRLLVARLQREAVAAGATLRGEVAVTGWDLTGGREGGALVHTADGTIETRWVVDAAGLKGASRFAGAPRPVPATELCVAAQEVRDVVDVAGAQAFLARAGAGEGEASVYTGVAGGYSIVNVQVHLHGEDGPTVSILTGSIPGLGHASGVSLLQDFVASQPWIGPRRFGGSRAIPLVPPLASLADGPLIRVGDAGRQVFAAHGSGIGAQLVLAAQLAEVLAAGGTGWDWNVQWQRRWGGLMCASVIFARFSRSLDPTTLADLFNTGMLSPGLAEAGLSQRPMVPTLGDVLTIARGAPRAPEIVLKMAPIVVRMWRVERHHRWYPHEPDGLARWVAHRDELTGDPVEDLHG